MSVAGISIVKDEADVIKPVIRHMLGQVDRVIVADNGSTDGTREILEGLDVELHDDPEVAFYQGRKISALAAESGAEWVVPFDGDEIWAGRDGRLGDVLDDLPESVLLAQAELYDQIATSHDGGRDPIARMKYRKPAPEPLRKVACRVRPGLEIGQGNHAATYEGVKYPPAALDLLVVRHFPNRSAEQFISKVRNGAAGYAATDLPDDLGAHKRAWGKLLTHEGTDALRKLFDEELSDIPGAIWDPVRL